MVIEKEILGEAMKREMAPSFPGRENSQSKDPEAGGSPRRGSEEASVVANGKAGGGGGGAYEVTDTTGGKDSSWMPLLANGAWTGFWPPLPVEP